MEPVTITIRLSNKSAALYRDVVRRYNVACSMVDAAESGGHIERAGELRGRLETVKLELANVYNEIEGEARHLAKAEGIDVSSHPALDVRLVRNDCTAAAVEFMPPRF